MDVTEKAEERMGALIDALGIRWEDDEQPQRAAKVIQTLANTKKSRSDMLRFLQVLFLDPQEPTSRDTACLKMVQNVVRKRLPTLSSGENGIRWCQALVLVTMEMTLAGADESNIAAVLFIGEMFWRVTDTRWHHQLVELWQIARYPTESKAEMSLSSFPKTTAVNPENVQQHISKRSQYAFGNNGHFNVAPQINAIFDQSIIPAINTLSAFIAQVDANSQNQVTHIKSILKTILASIEASSKPEVELNALWWGQSLYSKQQRSSYRDLSTSDRLWWMAEDLIDTAGDRPDPALTAYFIETAARVCLDLNESRSWADHAQTLLPTNKTLPSGAFEAFIRADATALPISSHLLSGTSTPLPKGDLTGRAFARQFFLERQLHRWLEGA